MGCPFLPIYADLSCSVIDFSTPLILIQKCPHVTKYNHFCLGLSSLKVNISSRILVQRLLNRVLTQSAQIIP